MSRKAAAFDWLGEAHASVVETYARSLESLEFPEEVRQQASFIGEDNYLARLLPKKYLEDFHTTSLAYFLNYRVAGDSERLLLDRFFQVLSRRMPTMKRQMPNALQGFEVEQEAKSDGWIDILISNPGTQQAIIVENKIWAVDQRRQLPRYYWDLTKQRHYEVLAAAYLSPLGHQPSTGDWEEEDINAVAPLVVAISYGELLEDKGCEKRLETSGDRSVFPAPAVFRTVSIGLYGPNTKTSLTEVNGSSTWLVPLISSKR